MTPPVAFVCAMPMELEPLIPLLGLRPEVVGAAEMHRGSIGDGPAVAIVTGMGPALAAEGLTRLVGAVPDLGRVAVVGICGALDPAVAIGTLIRPAEVIDGATGTSYRPSAVGSGDDEAAFAGIMWTSDRLIEDPGQVAELRERGVVALDMETATVGAGCASRGIPWSVFRAISDRAGDGSVDADILALSHPDGSPDLEAVERYFAAHPERVDAMAELAQGALLAARVAAEAACQALRTSG